ncbi:hypothetical protein CGRA01v4_04493 [Colletotrichum graminicola]|nr:hypothetical protein CGRA01v4_04493 [Colletotrichum graminicola]
MQYAKRVLPSSAWLAPEVWDIHLRTSNISAPCALSRCPSFSPSLYCVAYLLTTYYVGIISHFTPLSFPILSRAIPYPSFPSISDSCTRALTCLLQTQPTNHVLLLFCPPSPPGYGLCVARRYASRQKKNNGKHASSCSPPGQ